MAKEKSVYICSNCGYHSASYLGKCPQCNSWGTLEQHSVNSGLSAKTNHNTVRPKAEPISMIRYSESHRLDVNDKELNRVLGGGLVTGSVVLIGGEPGIGKSTLLLQVALKCADKKVLYVSGEESAEQIKLRQLRMKISSDNCLVLSATDADDVIETAKEVQPQMVIIDSVQTMTAKEVDSFAGSISQVRACADKLTDYAKMYNVPVILVGHITKDGTLAGPKILEHMVDTVLQFEGDKNYGYRILRSVKNRFGSTNEIGIYEMTSYGLTGVDNPSKILLSQREEQLCGVSVCATLEGRRTILIETQALVSPSYYSSPQRVSNGFDIRRLNMLLAVLEKKAGVKVSNKDVFLNIAGGLHVNDPAIDLSVITSIISSHQDIAVNNKYCFAAEIGLSGEIRPVPYIDRRLNEAQAMGFEKIFLSKYNKDNLTEKYKIKTVLISSVNDLIEELIK
ncbi:MAG: DNA repair protein RadA [Bacteroidales bacterium]|nr:DNA repair protein RadA [Bacteroidales bacterium]